jgi:hypothetical protein
MPASTRSSIASPLGDVRLLVRFEPGIQIESVPVPELHLPAGMSIDGAALVRVTTLGEVSAAQPLTLEILADFEAEPESGEWLDSVVFSTPGGRLQVGTRDTDYLRDRGIACDEVEYTARGMRLAVREAPAATALFVSIAWRLAQADGGQDDMSTWFAVELALP